MSAAWPTLDQLTAELPDETDVLVAGGGLAGTLLTRELAGHGIEVTLVERGELNREASGTNAGSVHLQIAIHQLTGPDTSDAVERLTLETRLAVRAAEIWQALDRDTGGRIGYHQIGGMMVAEAAEEVALLHDKHRLESEAGLETRVLTGDELRSTAPYLSPSVQAATWCPQEGHVDPLAAVPAIAGQALDRGARIRIGAAVTSIRGTGAGGGGPFIVQTAAGPIRARRIVNAAGAWAGELCAMVGHALPVTRMALHVNVTEARPPLVSHLVQHVARRLTLKQSPSGTIIIGGGWPARETPGRATTSWASAAGNAAVAVDVIPGLAGVRLVRTWSGTTAWMHDVSPLLGELTAVPGFHTCVVASSGYTMTPVFVEMLAERLRADDPPPLSPAYAPDRPPRHHPIVA